METIAYYFDEKQSYLLLGKKAELRVKGKESLSDLATFLEKHSHSYKGIALSYDLKEALVNLSSTQNDYIEFPDVICWIPEHTLHYDGQQWTVLESEEQDKAMQLAAEFSRQLMNAPKQLPKLTFEPSETRASYLKAIQEIQEEIQKGNLLETNYCQEFVVQNVPEFDSMALVKSLNDVTKAPFSAYLKIDEFELFSGSPERFLKKEGQRLISQPIKGTAPRGRSEKEDVLLKESLLHSVKDKTENDLAVEIVQQDLAKIAKNGQVTLEEFAAIYSFKTVHHLISTLSCELDDEVDFVRILKAMYPMASMTGNPSLKAIEITDKLEKFRRGLYSGSVGYITPSGDFDLNVIIRSIVKNNAKKIMTCCAGGGITNLSDAAKEYEECFVKVGKILTIFDA